MSATSVDTSPANANGVAHDPFEMVVPEPGSGPYGPLPADNYPATIVGLLHVGTQPYTKKDDDGTVTNAERPEIVIILEIADELEPNSNRPYLFAVKMAMSLYDKANYYKLMAALLGRKLESGDKVTARDLLGQPCMAEVKVVPSKDGKKQYNNIGTITKLARGMATPKHTRPLFAWTVFDGTPIPDLSWAPRVFGSPLADIIQVSREYRLGTVHFGEKKADDDGGDIPF